VNASHLDIFETTNTRETRAVFIKKDSNHPYCRIGAHTGPIQTVPYGTVLLVTRSQALRARLRSGRPSGTKIVNAVRKLQVDPPILAAKKILLETSAAGERTVVFSNAFTDSKATIARLASTNQRHLRWPTDEMGKPVHGRNWPSYCGTNGESLSERFDGWIASLHG
jgi:hypothetical protein